MRERFPLILLISYIVFFALLGIRPYSRDVWWAENIPILLIVLALAISHRWFRFSNTAYGMMAVLIFMHTIGGHYTFERVPFGFVTDLFHFQRNHYDRVAHFSVGLYAFATMEFIERRRLSNSRTLTALFAVAAIFSTAAIYEIFEFVYAVMADPAAGIAVLGSQGDIWDAQKDMLADGLGSIAAALFYLAWYRKPPLDADAGKATPITG
jgi:putative membrane protein